jgi:AcrR family transcriptional regulator
MRASKTRTEVRQEQIAQAALDLIARGGVAGVSLAGVAGEVGVVPSAIYRHFRGKDEVLDVVLDLIGRRLGENVQAVRAEITDPRERLHRLFLRHLELIRTNAGIPRTVLSEEIFAGQPRRKAKMHGIIRHYLGEVALLVREGQADGGFRADLDPDTAAVVFLGLIQPAAILWLMSDGKFDLAQHAKEAWRQFRIILQSRDAGGGEPAPDGGTKGQRRSGQ